MCGRYTLSNTGQLSLRFGVMAEAGLEPRYNVAPSQEVPVVVAGYDGPSLEFLRWGFRPAWAGESTTAPINARAETLLDRPLFRGALARHRCLIPADGFYEWQEQPGRKTKQPFHIRLRDGELFAFAGLYTVGKDGSGGTCALITTSPNDLMAPIHNRMPAILRPEDEARWLDPELTIPEAVLSCLGPYPDDLMTAYPVSTRVSNVRNDGPDLIQPLVVR